MFFPEIGCVDFINIKDVLFLPVEQEIETSSLCLQLCAAQPLCGQLTRLVSDPVQCTLSIQIIPSPGPYS